MSAIRTYRPWRDRRPAGRAERDGRWASSPPDRRVGGWSVGLSPVAVISVLAVGCRIRVWLQQGRHGGTATGGRAAR